MWAGIGRRMLELRVQQGLTQTELAGDRFTRAYVSSIEGGKRTPSPAAAGYFAARLGTDLEDLCFGYAPGRRRALLAEAAEARVALSDGDTERASAVYEALCAEAEEHRDRTLRALGRYGLGLVARHGGDPGAGAVLFEEADALLHDRPLTERLPALMGRVWALFASGAIDDAPHGRRGPSARGRAARRSRRRSSHCWPRAACPMWSGVTWAGPGRSPTRR